VIQHSLRINSVSAKYSDSQVNMVTMECFLDFYSIDEPFHSIAIPYVERLSVGLSNYDESK